MNSVKGRRKDGSKYMEKADETRRKQEAARLEAQAKAYEKITDMELKILGLKAGMKVLDAGCGTGVISRKMAKIVYPAEVHGVDIDEVFIEEAKRMACEEGIENVKFEVGDVNNLDYPDGLFDITYCRLVLMHVEDPIKTVEELKRVTKNGGILAVDDNDDGTVIIYPPVPRFAKLWSKYIEWKMKNGTNRCLGRELFSILSQAGLKPVDIHLFPTSATQQNPKLLSIYVSVPFGHFLPNIPSMIKEGITTKEEYDEMMKEVESARTHPGAFVMGTFFLAVGRVP